MKQILIDKNEILSFPREDYSGFANFTYDMIDKNNLTDRFDEAYQLCKDILDGLMNVIETAEVIEEREIARCYCEYNYDTDRYEYSCSNCGNFIITPYGDEDFKFCPCCGAKYEKIVRH